MVERTETWEEDIRWYAERDWPQNAVESLLAYCFVVDRAAKKVTLRAIFDHSPSDDEKDDIWALEGDIGVHFPDDWLVCTNLEVIPSGQAADLGGADVIYRRGDAMTPFQRWQQKQVEGEASGS